MSNERKLLSSEKVLLVVAGPLQLLMVVVSLAG